MPKKKNELNRAIEECGGESGFWDAHRLKAIKARWIDGRTGQPVGQDNMQTLHDNWGYILNHSEGVAFSSFDGDRIDAKILFDGYERTPKMIAQAEARKYFIQKVRQGKVKHGERTKWVNEMQERFPGCSGKDALRIYQEEAPEECHKGKRPIQLSR
jgi:hypothetical protein